jgi:hypothetical protein
VIKASYKVRDGVVTAIAGDAFSRVTATVRRSADVIAQARIPIGTREADSLTMWVNDFPVDLQPGPGQLTRRSYAVNATYRSVNYRLDPRTSDASWFRRDDRFLGTFTRSYAGEIDWEPIQGVEVTATDAVMGYALAAAFGTGAASTVLLVIEAAFRVIGLVLKELPNWP